MTTVGGSLDASGANTKTAFPKLTTVGGHLYASGPDTKTAFPKLTTVGGSLYASGDTGHIKSHDSNAAPICKKALSDSLGASGLIKADSILAKVVNRKGGVFRIIITGTNKVSYLVRDGESWSHGRTLAEARESLIYKITSRDTSEFKSWTLKTVVDNVQFLDPVGDRQPTTQQDENHEPRRPAAVEEEIPF